MYPATSGYGQAGYLHLDLRRSCRHENLTSSATRVSVALVVAEAPVPPAGMAAVAAVAGCPSAYFRADPVCLLVSN